MLTPFFRVLASVAYFLVVLKNWKYTVFTLFVLLVLPAACFCVNCADDGCWRHSH